ncbi:MAG: hypothetical protein RLZZ28_811 [Bacteroidota bacterium]
MNQQTNQFSSKSFGNDFLWGIAIAAAQNEGAYNKDDRGLSIWDVFSKRPGKIKNGAKPTENCDFYHRYKDDLLLAKALGFKSFRFSVSWSRILPEGTGKINAKGLLFYHAVIDECLKLGLIPYITLYHWDLPQALEKEGGWTSHSFLRWFSRFVTICAEEYGAKVKNWLILNEPAGFTLLGYLVGKHAPGKIGLPNFLSAVHNATLAQAEGGRIIRNHVKQANIGTAFSCSEVTPYTESRKDIEAANRVDILLNRLFLEPSLGMGYPDDQFSLMEKLHLHSKAWKFTKQMQFDFDFIGVQNYFPITVKHSTVMPFVQAIDVKAATRKMPHTDMGWEINADSFYRMLKRFAVYDQVKAIIVTENGAFFKDKLVKGVVNDQERIRYFEQYLSALLKARKEGVPVNGYFAWTLMDNFEWSEGFHARFGLVHVDFNTQLRTIKQSGHWFRSFLTT